MNNYTIDLETMHRDPNFKMFNFDYNFYTEDVELKNDFEKIFLQHYRFYEIGFETVNRFKSELQARLNLKHTYYKKLYETELAAIGKDFLVNKNYSETTTREVLRELSENVANNTNEILTNNLQLDSKESNLANGIADIGLDNGKLTKLSEDKNTGTSETKGNNSAVRENTAKDKETITLECIGDIGVTTAADMLKSWRSILLDINNMLIKDCRDLFLYIY